MDNSLILTEGEYLALVEKTNWKNGNLLYRASTDGFTAYAFHSKCVGKSNIFIMIKNNLNHVFGAYVSSVWSHDSGKFITDFGAFIVSIRRREISDCKIFKVKNAEKAVYINSSYGPAFGQGCDIYICNQSNIHMHSYSNFGVSYELSEGLECGSDNAKNFLAGNFNEWLTTEIEVYQITKT